MLSFAQQEEKGQAYLVGARRRKGTDEDSGQLGVGRRRRREVNGRRKTAKRQTGVSAGEQWFRLPGLFTDSFSARCWAGFFFLFIFQRVHGHDYAGALGRAAHETGFRFTPYVLNYNYKSFHK